MNRPSVRGTTTRPTVPFVITPTVPSVERRAVRALMAGFEKSGKTYDSILWALWHCGIDPTGWTEAQVREFAPRSPVVVIETSREDVGIYAKVLPFRVVSVPPNLNNPANIVAIIQAFESDPTIEAVVVDSYSEFWEGEGGVLTLVNQLGANYQAWDEIKKMENTQFAAMRDSRLDLWFTVRMKD